MIEIFSIYTQLFIFIIIFQFPLNKLILNKYGLLNVNYFEILIYNIILNSIFYLIISFLSFDLKFYFIFQIVFGSLFFILNFIYFIRNSKKNFDNHKILIAIFLLLNIILFSSIALNLRIEWDGLAHWIQKAQVYFQNGSYSELRDVSFAYYPHFGGFLWGYFWKNSILQLEYLGRLILPFFYLSGIFYSVSTLFKKEDYFIKILAILLIFTLTLDYYLFGGYQDYYIFFQLLIFSKIFYEYQKMKHSKFHFTLLFLITILILWTKQEGFFYNFILTLIFILFCNKDNKTKFTFTFFVISSIVIQIYLKKIYIGSFEFNEPVFHDGLLRYLNLTNILETFLLISKHIIISMFRYPIWILILFILLYFEIFDKKSKLPNYSLCYLFIFFGFVYAIYFQTKMPLDFLLPITIDRVLLQGSGFMIYPILLCFQKFILDKFKT